MRIKTLAVAGVALLASSPVWAAGMGGDMNGMSGMSGGQCTHYKTMGGETGVHSMTGSVASINHRTGMISLKTAEGMLRLHFPPQSLKKVRKGEHLKVNLGFSPEH